MTDFDDRFAARVREAFDAYEEPVDEAAWARTQAALASGVAPEASSRAASGAAATARRRAADRGAVGSRQRRALWLSGAALAALVLVAGVWLARPDLAPQGDAPAVAATPSTADPAPNADASGDAADSLREATPDASLPERVPPLRAAPGGERTPFANAAPRRSEASHPASGEAADVAAQSEDVRDEPEPLAPEEPRVALGETRAAPEAEGPLPDVAEAQPPSVVVQPERGLEAPEAWGTIGPDLMDITVLESPYGGTSLVAASTSAFSADQRVDGLGASLGVVREVALARGFAVSGGAVAAYNSFTLTPAGDFSPAAFDAIEDDPTLSVDVPQRRMFSTLALEVPLDVMLDVLAAPGGRVGVSVGVTSAVYLAQSFREEGRTISADVVTGTSGDRLAFEAQGYTVREAPGPLSRFDIARQLNLGVRFTPDRAPLAVEAYARLPLAGLTSQDLALTTAGLRLRAELR